MQTVNLSLCNNSYRTGQDRTGQDRTGQDRTGESLLRKCMTAHYSLGPRDITSYDMRTIFNTFFLSYQFPLSSLSHIHYLFPFPLLPLFFEQSLPQVMTLLQPRPMSWLNCSLCLIWRAFESSPWTITSWSQKELCSSQRGSRLV